MRTRTVIGEEKTLFMPFCTSESGRPAILRAKAKMLRS